MTEGNKCYKEGCDKTTDLRPYGPRGEWVCFKCAFATPEDKAATEKSFGSQLDAAGTVVVLGEETGPRPLRNIFANDSEVNQRLATGEHISLKEIRSHLSPEEGDALMDLIRNSPLQG